MINLVTDNLRKLVLFCIIGFLSVGCCQPANQKTTNLFDSKKAIDHLSDSTVLIMYPEMKRTCTGFFISPTMVVTARHCFVPISDLEPEIDEETNELIGLKEVPLSRKQAFELYEKEKNKISISMISRNLMFTASNYLPTSLIKKGSIVWSPTDDYEKKHDTHDFVFIELDPGQLQSKSWLNFESSIPRIGEEVFMVSHPGGFPWVAQYGRISAYFYDFPNFPNILLLRAQMPVAEGSSGGALVNNDEKIVGIAISTTVHRTTGMFIPSYVMLEQLNKYKSHIRNVIHGDSIK